ncbi:MAG: ATP-dependent DNA helicase [Pseudomonadota bacterium]
MSRHPSPNAGTSDLPLMAPGLAHFANFADAKADLAARPVMTSKAGMAFQWRGGVERELSPPDAAEALGTDAHILAGLPRLAQNLRLDPGPALDLLELFAFVHPARFCLPDAEHLSALVLGSASDPSSLGPSLIATATSLLEALRSRPERIKAHAAATAQMMERAGWLWGPYVLAALEDVRPAASSPISRLPDWEDETPPPPPRDVTLDRDEVETHLGTMTARLATTQNRVVEERPGQRAFTRTAARIFRPREVEDAPHVELAEAGTGIGKTLGYLAPAERWARASGGTVWIATFTKALQRQIDRELQQVYPDDAEKARKVVIRKGRENYLCLLNLEEGLTYARSGAAALGDAVFIGLVERWVAATRDGDMVGGDFPSWLGAYFGAGRLARLTDRRGECIYSACAHYRKCFIEKSTRAAVRADIVVANHALVMVHASRGAERGTPPTRLIFDEAHHLFDAADAAFSAHLSGREGSELKRWLIGGGRAKGRLTKGLSGRLADLIANDDKALEHLAQLTDCATVLPSEGWLARARDGLGHGAMERFLGALRAHILARAAIDARQQSDRHSIEADITSPEATLIEAATALQDELRPFAKQFLKLAARLHTLIEEESDTLDTPSRNRLDQIAKSLVRRHDAGPGVWLAMLNALLIGPQVIPPQTKMVDPEDAPPPKWVDWASLERFQGREIDVGLHRHALDPTEAFAAQVLRPVHGALLTSATLRDQHAPAPDLESDDQSIEKGGAIDDESWRSADVRTGAAHLMLPPGRSMFASPFAYAEDTEVLIVDDVSRRSLDQIAAAYRVLIEAAGGATLGLFTAIERLRAVYSRLVSPMAEAGLPLYAQHIDPMDTGTLIDLFRAEKAATLLGTDAVRDGIDVPGDSLKLIVFDRVPWPRPSLLHRARRQAFGGRDYDDMLVRLRLKQAYGRLVRRAGDRGMFVILDPALPTRLTTAFPEGVAVTRLGLADAVARVEARLP